MFFHFSRQWNNIIYSTLWGCMNCCSAQPEHSGQESSETEQCSGHVLPVQISALVQTEQGHNKMAFNILKVYKCIDCG